MLTAEQELTNTMRTYQRARSTELLLQEARAQLNETLESHRREATYSLSRLLKVSGELDMSHAPIEVGQSERLAAAYGRQPRLQNSAFLPIGLQRDLAVGTSSAGGYLVSPSNELRIGVPGGSNSLLDRVTVVRPGSNTGAQRIGKFTAMPTTYILANEQTAITEYDATVHQTLMVPTHATAYLEQSRQLALQSDGGAAAMAALLTNALRTAAGVQIIDGAGSNGEVVGLCADGAVTKAAGTTVALSHVVAALAHVEKNAGDGELAWAVTAPAAAILRARAVISGGNALLQDGKIGGYPVVIIGGTTAAHAVFGRWKDLLVYEWAPLEVAVNPFASFQAAIVGLRGWLAFSAAPLVSTSFYVIEDIT